MSSSNALPGAQLATEKMPGHWLLARLGKRVLRPGGRELTQRMVDALQIHETDNVVELAPGLGVTAMIVLDRRPATYTGVEADVAAAHTIEPLLNGTTQRCVAGKAQETGIASGHASVIYGEAMLTMQTQSHKGDIAREAHRVLRTGGRYAIHELCLVPDSLSDDVKNQIQKELSAAIHVGARPLTQAEWRTLLEDAGFTVTKVEIGGMKLLEPARILSDEGFVGTLRFVANVIRDSAARARVLAMRKVFRRYSNHLAAIMIVAEAKPGSVAAS